MTRNDFLKDLELRLAKLPEEHRRSVMADYTEHFEVAVGKGKTESETALALGTPRQIAAACLADLAVARVAQPQSPGSRAVAAVRALFAIVGLAFFNGMFVLMPCLFIVFGVVTFWALALSPLIIGSGWIVEAVREYGTGTFASFEGLGHLFMSMALLSLGAALVLGMALATKLLAQVAMRYLRLNVQIITN